MPLSQRHVYPASVPEFTTFASRRSVVHSTNGMVACSQPLAAQAGIDILRQGGNAAVGFYLYEKAFELLMSKRMRRLQLLPPLQ